MINKFRKNSAITLIAMVITIIILLILAGVGIQALTNTGLFEKAKKSKEKSDYSAAYEKLMLKINEAQIEKNGKCTLEELEELWGKEDEIDVIIMQYNKTAKKDKNINSYDAGNLKNMLVKMSGYEKYYFLLDVNCDVIKVSKDYGKTFSDIKKENDGDKEVKDNEEILEYTDDGRILPVFDSSSNNKDGVTIYVSDFYDAGTSGPAFGAVDGNYSTTWSTESGNYNPHWFKVEFDVPKIIDSYYLNGACGWGQQYKFYLEASEDGENWMSLENGVVHDGVDGHSAGEWKVELDNEKAYKYYRVYFPQGGWTYGTSGGAAICELQLYGDKIRKTSLLEKDTLNYDEHIQYYAFKAKANKKYKIECYGAQGGSYFDSNPGGYGGYTYGIFTANKDTVIYIYTGGQGKGSIANAIIPGGYNGGGAVASTWGDGNEKRASGGGATHIALVPGLLSSLENNKSDIIMVAGGGGGSGANSVVYNSTNGFGGNGGGLEGKDGKSNRSDWGTGGTQTTAGINASFGKGGESTHGLLNGGGAGWFGGGTGWLAAGGGSGYINTQYLQNSETTTSTHTGNGECKITVLK